MSIVTDVSVSPRRIEIVWRYLRGNKEGETIKDLVGVLASSELSRRSSEPAAPKPVVNEATRLGVLEEFKANGEKRVRVPEQLCALGEDGFRAYLESVLLTPRRGKEGNFARAIAWMLTKSPARPISFQQNVGDEVRQDCKGSVLDLSSTARFQHFVYWARYLGYAWLLDSGAGTVVMPDPTHALMSHVRELLVTGEEVALADLVSEWETRCPVLEGGKVRSEIEALSSKDQRQPEDLSASTSFALMRLQRRGLLKLDRKADFRYSMRLLTWPEPTMITHVRRLVA